MAGAFTLGSRLRSGVIACLIALFHLFYLEVVVEPFLPQLMMYPSFNPDVLGVRG
ncbi:hypothetical protein N657DRAFT_645928 [Parathielavia appendiculata]|uniref:Uncharacterized protein n=1 Tax=Parathielavia appendiculata TaxID=2587402 RepID=A0AAN6Z331_9PEZI|nr:hypothetical protein N657DRAFT_645928 [Parathielavia appendiculata]